MYKCTRRPYCVANTKYLLLQVLLCITHKGYSHLNMMPCPRFDSNQCQGAAVPVDRIHCLISVCILWHPINAFNGIH